MAHQNRRQRLFDIYSRNLALLSALYPPPVDLNDKYVCPLCTAVFSREALNIDQALTLEHVPPQAVGGVDGKGILLCGDCNHTAGSQLDRQILNMLYTNEFLQRVPGASVSGTYRVGPAENLAGTFMFDDHALQIQGDPKRSNPAEKAKEAEYIQSPDERARFSFGISFNAGRLDDADVGLLRIAFLMVFRVFGYALIFHQNMMQVRQQIMDRKSAILPRRWVVNGPDLQQWPTGIHIITEPVEARCFLVVFELTTERRTTKHFVVLPNTAQPGIAVYDWLSEPKDSVASRHIHAKTISEDKDLLLDPDLCLISRHLWDE